MRKNRKDPHALPGTSLRPAPPVAKRRRLRVACGLAAAPLAAAWLLFLGNPAAAAGDNPPDFSPAVEQSQTVPEPAAPWLALVFAAILIALRNRMLRR